MYIAKVQIKNYKSFLSSQELNLTPGFNVVVGQNNAGKTALVEALGLHFDSKIHMSMKTVPSLGVLLHDSFNSSVQITFQLAEGEAEQLLINARGSFYLPSREGTDPGSEVTKFQALLRQAQILQCMYQPNNFVTTYLEYLDQFADAPYVVELRVNISQRQLEYTSNRYQITQIDPKYNQATFLALEPITDRMFCGH